MWGWQVIFEPAIILKPGIKAGLHWFIGIYPGVSIHRMIGLWLLKKGRPTLQLHSYFTNSETGTF